jgi:small conductance mechanosensitive channel
MLWVISIGLLSRSFYFTRPFANWLLGVWPREWLFSLGRSGVLGTPLLLLLIFLAVSLLDRFIDLVIDRLARQWLESQTEAIQASHRFSLRVPTLVSAAKGVSTVIAYALFILIALQQFRAISTPIATFLGIITFAISLGAQNFIKDVINGVLLLLEDQYAVGDVIAINNQVDGLVEYVNLRITQLRNLDGELITIPNGTISIVRNMTSSWSQAKLVVTVGHDTAVDHAIAVMEQVAQDLYTDPQWEKQVMEEPIMLGVEKLDADGCQLLMLLKTQPMRHWDVAREYRRRLKSAFEQEAIALGMPRQRIFVESSPRHSQIQDAIQIGEVRSPHITQNSHP